jgi:phosphoribosylanthranilate isomerase
MLIKICGLTNQRDAELAIGAGADLVGFVFVPGTPRALDPSASGWIRELVGAATVGVFRDASIERIADAKAELGLDWIQLHGDEPDAFIDAFGSMVIRRIVPTLCFDWRSVDALGQRCMPLLDPGAGDGVEWDWAALNAPPPTTRFGLAGGLTPDSVAEAVRALRPWLVDVSSGVESSPGLKDPKKVLRFIESARAAAESGKD